MKTLTRILTACALLFTMATNGQILNGTFDVNNPGSGWYCGSSIYGWNISGTGDIQWENQWNLDGDDWWVDITGCGWGNGKWIEQTVATVPGTIYTLSFDLGCWNGQCYTDAGADLYIDGAYINRYAHTDFTGHQLAWETFTYCFTAWETSTTIRFVGNGAATFATQSWANPINDFVGVIGLDNVKLDRGDAEILYDHFCTPVVLTHHSGGGIAYWFLNGAYQGSGDSWNANVPGTYKLVYKTECGEASEEIVLEDCKKSCEMEPDFNTYSVETQKEKETYCAGEWISFNGFSNNGTALEYSWNFGDGGGTSPFSLSNTALHRYLHPGTYNVCMTVWLKPTEYIPLCHPYTICKTITIVDCTPYEPGDGGTLPDDPGTGNKSLAMQLSYPALEAFPNPVADQVTIKGLMESETETELSLYTISGTLVWNKTVAPGTHETTLSTKELNAGVYLLKVTGRDYHGELKLIKK